MTEDQLEQLALSWFRESGYAYAFGPDIGHDGDSSERADYRQVILPGRLSAALEKINPSIPKPVLEDVATRVQRPGKLSLLADNRQFHEWLVEGVPVEIERNGRKTGDKVVLVDFASPDRNEFLVVNQYTVQGTKQPRRADIVVFINGLPIAVIELKNPADEQADIWAAYHQLQTYKAEISDLFIFNEALVISDGTNARLGSLVAGEERFMRWRTVMSERDRPLLSLELEILVRGFFNRELLLDYLRYFILFEANGDKLDKKIAGYHQYHAVREAVRATIAASSIAYDSAREIKAQYADRVVPGCKKGGVIWHTQGSGKSISMACFAGMLIQQPAMRNPTVLVVTDRNDLDGQLFETFAAARMLLRQSPIQADNVEELRTLLSARPAGGIFFTTIQKFQLCEGEECFPTLNDRHNIVVIADEAHRSHYGDRAVLNRKTGRYSWGYSKNMRNALPNATFVGFTGTPISQDDRDTVAVFGEYVSIYDIQDAVEDGATVPIYYESRLAKLDLKEDEIPRIDDEVEEVIEDDEDSRERELTKSKWAALEKLVGAKPRIDQVAKDIVEHFEIRSRAVAGKAMIVCMSREICVQLYNALVVLRPEWHSADPLAGVIKIIMTGSASDRSTIQPHIYNARVRKQIEKRFKKPDDPLKIVIVRDMWLTGFDAPVCHTMYIDKPMKGHNLMQAIARVNRVFKGKEGGLVVDYLGIANELRDALVNYTQSRGKGKPTIDTHEAIVKTLEYLDIARALLHGFDYSSFAGKPIPLLVPAANHILGQDEGKRRFFDAVLALSKAYSLCSTLDEARPFSEEVAFLQAVKAVIAKASGSDTKFTEEQKHGALKQILDNAVVARGIDDIFALAGLGRPDISILSDEFLAEVASMPARNLAVELLERLMNDEIKSRLRTNVVQERKYSERLLETLKKYRNRSIESAQVIEELISLAKEFRDGIQRGEKLGLSTDELAFYDALADNESAVHELGDDMLKKIAREVTEKLRNSTTVDWQKRDSIRARLRNIVRITLKKHKYPPDKTEEAVELVLKQAETLSNEWSQRD